MRSVLLLVVCGALGASGGRPAPGDFFVDDGPARDGGMIADAARRDGASTADGAPRPDGPAGCAPQRVTGCPDPCTTTVGASWGATSGPSG